MKKQIYGSILKEHGEYLSEKNKYALHRTYPITRQHKNLLKNTPKNQLQANQILKCLKIRLMCNKYKQ